MLASVRYLDTAARVLLVIDQPVLAEYVNLALKLRPTSRGWPRRGKARWRHSRAGDPSSPSSTWTSRIANSLSSLAPAQPGRTASP